MPDLLMHICCAPCLCWPHRELAGEGIHFTGLWFNPAIHPYTEYAARLKSVRAYAELKRLEVEYLDEYPLERTLEALRQERCDACYRIRLERTARYAKDQGFAAFSTTLLYSKHQKHDRIREIGQQAGRLFAVEFMYRDFRPGWAQGREAARTLGLYRQKYCGCIFSERDRYLGERDDGNGRGRKVT